MNLIERLGGYGKAKQKYSERPFDLAWSDIGKALLEHRREKNIFEVGDKIVSAFDNIEMFGNSTVEIARFRDDINCIDLIEGTYVRLTNGCDCNLDQFRHATDKEIAQGYRDE